MEDGGDLSPGKEPALLVSNSTGAFIPRNRTDSRSARPCQQPSTFKHDAKAPAVKSHHWLHKMTSWLATAEPSAQALKHHKKEMLRKAGLPKDDPEAGTKLRAPVGEIPADAIHPAGNWLDPEGVFGRKKDERRRDGVGPLTGSQNSDVFGSMVSGSSSGKSGRPKTGAGSEVFPFD
ncbi:hypothetical protein GE09DRAFT_437099 [Coniochaeta sp. 2T2.1]|nr:hypothetical protein GE09DRAFT_437099 [Coniochaeta sp. 2T2.1]